MRLVRLKLREPTPFWILNPIMLQKGKELSPLINIDLLNKKAIEIINKSVAAQEIFIYDQEGKLVKGDLSNINMVNGNFVSVDDIENDEDIMPQIVSVTIEEDDTAEEEEEVLAEHMEEASILLDRNGNTVRKAINGIERSSNSLLLLRACLAAEADQLHRTGVLRTIEKVILECKNG